MARPLDARGPCVHERQVPPGLVGRDAGLLTRRTPGPAQLFFSAAAAGRARFGCYVAGRDDCAAHSGGAGLEGSWVNTFEVLSMA